MDNLDIPGLNEESLAKLDRIEIRGRNSVEARIACGIELFVAPQGEERTPQFYRELLCCIENYYACFKDNLNTCILPNANKVLKIKGDPIPRWEKALNEVDENYGYGMSVYYDNGVDEGDPTDATPWKIAFAGLESSQEELSYIYASMPVCNVQGENNFKVLFKMTLEWCEKLKPVHGSAGFCFAYAPDIEPQPRWTWAAMQRYPGINHHDPSMFSVKAKSVYNRIKGVNWLTVLGDEIVNELGGKDAIEAQLGKFCAIHSYDGGIIIVAGLCPQLGDTYSGLIPEHYKEVARVTRSVRFEDYRRPLLQLPEPIDRLDATFKWIRRFD